MENIFNAKILIIDDEPALQEMLITLLKNAKFNNIYSAVNGKQALQFLSEQLPDIILLDIMLPDTNGFDLFTQIQKVASVPVIFLSARDEDINKLKGLGLGADDYITKPFLPEELILRLCAVLRRTYTTKQQKINLGDTVIDMGNLSCNNGKETYALTATEYTIFKKLYENQGNIVTIDSLCNTVWKDGNFGYENTLMVHIRRLREKIEANPSAPKYLLTVRGLGYRLN